MNKFLLYFVPVTLIIKQLHLFLFIHLFLFLFCLQAIFMLKLPIHFSSIEVGVSAETYLFHWPLLIYPSSKRTCSIGHFWYTHRRNIPTCEPQHPHFYPLWKPPNRPRGPPCWKSNGIYVETAPVTEHRRFFHLEEKAINCILLQITCLRDSTHAIGRPWAQRSIVVKAVFLTSVNSTWWNSAEVSALSPVEAVV